MELVLLSISKLIDHPKNPRVMLRQDVVDGIACQLKESREFSQKHALHVRPVGSSYEIVSGHHRKQAATQAGIENVWCWVEDMDDDSAFMALVLSNSQGELDPLEIGIHAFEAVPEGKRGRGNKGDGLKAYAEKIGKHRPSVVMYRDAGEVVANVSIDRHKFIANSEHGSRAQHLSAIHKLPRECWQTMAQWIADRSPSVEQVKAMAERVAGCCEAAGECYWFPVDDIALKCVDTPDFSGSSVSACMSIAEAFIQVVQDLTPADAHLIIEEFSAWLRSNIAGDAWNRRKLQVKVDTIRTSIEQQQDEAAENWLLGDWRDHINKLQDGSVHLLLIDPPYGMDYQSNRRKEKHATIQQDDSLGSAADELLQCLQLVKAKLADDSHIHIFCRWDSESAFMAMARAAGLVVKGRCIWFKENHGSGDLKGGYAPQHESIIHAVNGSPVLYERHSDVFQYAKEQTTDHPTEKPVALLQKLIECTTVEGQLIVDLFAGVASTLVAAKNANRKWFGCEIDAKYYAIGAAKLGVHYVA